MTSDKKTRRRYSELKKAQVLAECSEPGASVLERRAAPLEDLDAQLPVDMQRAERTQRRRRRVLARLDGPDDEDGALAALRQHLQPAQLLGQQVRMAAAEFERMACSVRARAWPGRSPFITSEKLTIKYHGAICLTFI